jgi:hypothetical protein
MSNDEELRVPRREARVELALRGAAPRKGVLFLSPDLPESPQRDDVSHFLEQAPAFFPFREDGKGTTLVARDACLWLRAPLAGDDEEDGVLYEHALEVDVELDSAEGISGSFFWSAPHDHERLLDQLNAQERFLRLVGAETVCFVHKLHVNKVSAD